MPALRNADSLKATSMGNFSRNAVRRKSKAKPAQAQSTYSTDEIRQLQQMILVDKVPADEAARAVIAQRPPKPEPEPNSKD